MSKPNKGIWGETAWVGLFTDPYISGIGELERGHFSTSMNVRVLHLFSLERKKNA